MKKVFLSCFLFLILEIGLSQNLDSLRVEKIIIWDSRCDGFGCEFKDYEILLEDSVYKLYDTNHLDSYELKKLINKSRKNHIDRLVKRGKHDEYNKEYEKIRKEFPQPKTFIQIIDNQLVINVYKALKMHRVDNPLESFDIDSLWLQENVEKIFKEQANDWRKSNSKNDSIARQNLKNYSLVKSEALTLTGSYGTDDYPHLNIKLFSNLDTLIAISDSNTSLMLPWLTSSSGFYVSYNHLISKSIGKLLPKKPNINKHLLDDEKSFLPSLFRRVINENIIDDFDYPKMKKENPETLDELEKHFKVEKVEFLDMSSIDWGESPWGAELCIRFNLKSENLASNVFFELILGQKPNLYPIDSFINSKNEIEQRLLDNFVYQYVIKKPDTIIADIHFVNDKSLSGKARKNFNDCKIKLNRKIKSFNLELEKAIFFEVSKNNINDIDYQFSRWIILPNGMSILWSFEGNKVLDWNKNQLRKDGCIVFDKNGKKL